MRNSSDTDPTQKSNSDQSSKNDSSITQKDKNGWRFAVFYFISFMAVSLYGIYGNLYFRRRGVSNVELGILNAIPAWTGIFAPLLWGFISDAWRQRKLPSFLMHIIAALIFPLFWFWSGDSFLSLCLLMAVFTIFFSASIPIADAWTLDHIARKGGDYGRLRSWGSVGFIVPLLASLYFLKKTEVSQASSLLPIFYGFCIFRIISAFYSLTLPEYHAKGKKTKLDWGSLRVYLHPFALTFFFAIFMSRFLFGPYYTFFSIFLDDQGISDNLKGMYWVTAVAAETGLIAVSGSLLKRFGAVPMLLSGLAAMAFRMFIFSIEPAWYIILAAQTLHALTFGAFHVASIQIINRITPEAFRASGQTFNGALLGIGSLVGGVAGGIWAESYGLAGLFRILAITSAITTVVVAICFAIWREKDKSNKDLANA
jgi:MFS transporter, PPP family, 3-phenylpropionic acid transporter